MLDWESSTAVDGRLEETAHADPRHLPANLSSDRGSQARRHERALGGQSNERLA